MPHANEKSFVFFHSHRLFFSDLCKTQRTRWIQSKCSFNFEIKDSENIWLWTSKIVVFRLGKASFQPLNLEKPLQHWKESLRKTQKKVNSDIHTTSTFFLEKKFGHDVRLAIFFHEIIDWKGCHFKCTSSLFRFQLVGTFQMFNYFL